MQEPANQPGQPVPIKLVLPRWLIRGLIAFFIVCFVIVAALFVYSIYLNKQARNIFPPEEQQRQREAQQKELDNSRRKVEEGRRLGTTPSPASKAR